jgi:levansucrase
MALAAPRFEDPDERHRHARIHLLHRSSEGKFHGLGPAMPDGYSPGSREWSGSAMLGPERSSLTLYFTAAGRRGEATPSVFQRLFAATATLDEAGAAPRLSHWRDLREIVRPDPAFYMPSEAGSGATGTIKAFRDPGFFRDPADGARYLFFTGSAAGSRSAFNGVIGAAVQAPELSTGWRLLPPVVSADTLNNELERPHVIYRDRLYYLFWSTQSHVFDPAGPPAPTGLYGMASRTLLHGWQPLNGSGLVIANPEQAPRQAYSWLVLPDGSVTSFADRLGGGAAAPGARGFAGTFAPWLQLRLDGWSAILDD